MSDEKFLEKYEELLNKDYCNCNEMNCIDNNSPRRILNIAKKQKEVLDKIKEIFKDYGVKENIVCYSMYRITGEEVYTILELLEEIK